MASSISGGVLADDDASEGEGGKRERSGSKFRNSVQSEPKVGSVDRSRSSCGISNKAGKSSTRAVLSEKSASETGVRELNVCWYCMNLPEAGGRTQEGRDGGL